MRFALSTLLVLAFAASAAAGPIFADNTVSFGNFLGPGSSTNLGTFTYTIGAANPVDWVNLDFLGSSNAGAFGDDSFLEWTLTPPAAGPTPVSFGTQFYVDGAVDPLTQLTAYAPFPAFVDSGPGAYSVGLSVSNLGPGSAFVSGEASLSMNTPIAGVPEPGTWAIFGLGAMAAFRRLRRKGDAA